MEASTSRLASDMSIVPGRWPQTPLPTRSSRGVRSRCLRGSHSFTPQQSTHVSCIVPRGSPRGCRQVWVTATAVADASRETTTQYPSPDMGGATWVVTFDNNEPGYTVLRLQGPARNDMLQPVTNALNVLDFRVLSSKTLAHSEGVWTGKFHIQNDQENQVPDHEHDGLGYGLLQKLGIDRGESIQPSIHGDATDITSATEITAEGALELFRASSAMLLAAQTLKEFKESQPKDTRPSNFFKIRESQAATECERAHQRFMAAWAALRRPKIASQPSDAQGPGGELMAEEMGKKKSATGPAAGDGYEIFLQGFNWESCKKAWYKVIQSQIPQIVEAGFTAIWLPPPSNAVSAEGYLPRDLWDFNSEYGKDWELKELLLDLDQAGIKPIADVVINHRCAHYQDAEEKWNVFGGKMPWGVSAICKGNEEYGGTGKAKVEEDYPAAPNIDHSNATVKRDLTEWLQHLIRFGFRGWRLDYVKGYSGEVVKEYIQAMRPPPELAFGEYWDTCSYTDGVLSYNQDAHRQRIVDWVDRTGGTAAAFDFTTKGILQEAVGKREYWRLVDPQGKPPGVMGMWPSRAVTFIENHDTGSTLNHWPFPSDGLFEGYAYILTHPGTPCVFYDHFFSHDGLQESILALLAVRRRLRISARSEVRVQKAESQVYAAVVGEMLGVGEDYRNKCFIPKLAMKLGPGDWSANKFSDWQYGGNFTPPQSWKLDCSGPNFAVWEAEIVL